MWGGTTTTGNATFTTTSTGTAAYSNINASYTASPTSRRLTGELLSHINGIVEDNSLLETGITEKGGKSSQKNNPIIVSSDYTNAQNLDRSYTGIINIVGQSIN